MNKTAMMHQVAKEMSMSPFPDTLIPTSTDSANVAILMFPDHLIPCVL